MADAPRAARIGGVAAFAVAFVVALAPLARLRRPVRAETLDRLDRDSGAPHRPAASLDDRLAMAGEDPATAALWALHRDRLARQVERFVPPLPPRAWRGAIRARCDSPSCCAAIAAALVAGPERYGRVAAAFDWRDGAAAAATARLDAWIDPPAYANKPPILLDLAANRDPSQKIVTPEGSALVVRADADVFETRVEGAIAPVAGAKPADKSAPAATPPPGRAGRKALDDRRRRRGRLPPRRRRARPVRDRGDAARRADRHAARSAARQSQRLADAALFARRPLRRRRRRGRVRQSGRAAPRRRGRSFAPPKLALRLPSTANGTGEATTTGDLSEHPWAGAQVVMTLKATGVSGRVGAGAPTTFTLPQRQFHNPLARALVEQRRALVLDPDHEPPRVAKAIDALTIAPDFFQTPAGVYLGLRAGARAPRRRAWRRRSPRGRRPVVGDGAADRGRRRLAGAARFARRRAASCARRCSAARATRRCAS